MVGRGWDGRRRGVMGWGCCPGPPWGGPADPIPGGKEKQLPHGASLHPSGDLGLGNPPWAWSGCPWGAWGEREGLWAPSGHSGGLLRPLTAARLPLDIHRFSPCQERGRLTRQNSSQGPIPPPPPCPPSLGPGAPQNPWEALRERRLSSPSPNTCHRYGAGWGLWGGDSAAGKPPAPCPHAGLSPVGAEGARGKG